MTELDLEKINKFAPFCLSCLGRSVGLVGFGLDNRERGLEMANLIEISSGIDPSGSNYTVTTSYSNRNIIR